MIARAFITSQTNINSQLLADKPTPLLDMILCFMW